EFAGGIAPLIDVIVPFAGDNFLQAELIRSAVLGVGPVPGRPENERPRAVAPDHVEISRRKTLLTPVTRRRDDRLMFPHHVFKFLDRLDRHFVFRVTEIHERTGVSTVLGKSDLNASILVWRNNSGFLPTAGK